MTGSQLIAAIAAEMKIPQWQAKQMMLVQSRVAMEQLLAGNSVNIPGIAKLSVKVSAPRLARNPRTSEEINLPERSKVVAKIAKALQDEVKK